MENEIKGNEITLTPDPNLFPGWRLVDVIYNEEIVSMSDEIYDQNGCYHRNTRGAIIRKPVFMMSRPASEKIKEMEDKLNITIVKFESLQKEIKIKEEDMKKVLLQNAEFEKQIIRYKQFIEEMNKANTNFEKIRQELESDLGKVRKEIGEKRWREIITK